LIIERCRVPGAWRWGAALLAALLWLSWADGASVAAEAEAKADTLGCVLPLTGRHAAYGNAALDAVLLAAGVFDPRRETPIRLLIEDSRGEPVQARFAVENLAQAGVLGIVGPLGSQEALEAAAEAQRLRVPILTMTQREGITGIGDQVFRNFMTAAMQIGTIVQYARTEMGLNRFAVLYPEDAYGQEMARLFREEIRLQGGEISREVSYKTDQTDFSETMLMIGGAPAWPASDTGEEQQVALVADPDFEALFIPDAAFRVATLVPQLAGHGLTAIQLLGTSGWHSPELLSSDPGSFEGALFVDAFFTNSVRPATSDLIDRFYLAFGRVPGSMEALVYDATAMSVQVLLRDRPGTREAFREGLLALQGYPGATGRTSFSSSRDARKELFILSVRDGQIIQVR
jgi:ABC-type branched-subunit amino acid transport system substrate-binding protein